MSMAFSRQEYWSGLPFPSPGDLPHSGIEPAFPTLPALAARFFFSRLSHLEILYSGDGSPSLRESQFYVSFFNKAVSLITLNFPFSKNTLSLDVTFLLFGITESESPLSSSCEVIDSLEVLFKNNIPSYFGLRCCLV